jgi:hypothetical protein
LLQDFLKEGPVVLYMPSWLEKELQDAARFMYKVLTEEMVKDMYYKLGGVARGVLGLPSQPGTVDPVKELASAISIVTMEQVRPQYELSVTRIGFLTCVYFALCPWIFFLSSSAYDFLSFLILGTGILKATDLHGGAG